MEIERLGENKIRCALSEEEIREMGYNIDEIIGNTEVTQEFMRAVVELVEEQGNISMQNISPVVKAELLQDHSMAITFGGDSEMSFKNLVDTVGQLMNQLAPEKLSEFRQMNKEEKQSAIDDFLEKYKAKHSQDAKKTETEDAKKSSNTAFSYHMRAVLFTWNIRIRGIKDDLWNDILPDMLVFFDLFIWRLGT